MNTTEIQKVTPKEKNKKKRKKNFIPKSQKTKRQFKTQTMYIRPKKAL